MGASIEIQMQPPITGDHEQREGDAGEIGEQQRK